MLCNPDVALREAKGYGTTDWEWPQGCQFFSLSPKRVHREVTKKELCLCKT